MMEIFFHHKFTIAVSEIRYETKSVSNRLISVSSTTFDFDCVGKMSIKSSQALDRKALFYMFLLALQFGMQPLLTRRFTPIGICGSTVILVQEVLKFVMASAMLVVSGNVQSALSGE